MGSSLTSGGSLRRNIPCFVCHTCTPHLLCVVARTVGSHLLPCSLGNAPPSPLWRRAPLAGTRVRLPAFHGVPKHLSFWGYQKCPRTGGLFAHAPRKAEIVLWNSCTDSLHPNGPRQRRKLFTAALKLLWFAI